LGSAYYQKAELHRLRGEFADADTEYATAARFGHDPQPGLSQLRLAQGRLDLSEPAIRRVFEEGQPHLSRPNVLAAYVDVMLAAGDLTAARAAADELAGLSVALPAPYLRALSEESSGAVLLAEGDPRASLDAVRRALAGWQELEAPYETARARLLAGRACRALGDQETATMEILAARRVFEELGALPDVARAEHFLMTKTGNGLTPRELELLKLVAAGKTNKAIAKDLVISEKTVERHLSNIFLKLGVSSRAGATAYAYEHRFV
jgi:DNA-binding NarL/FixJ family response regulator